MHLCKGLELHSWKRGKPVVYAFRSPAFARVNTAQAGKDVSHTVSVSSCECSESKSCAWLWPEALEAIMSKAHGSTSTSIKHSDVPMEICHCGWVQTKRKYTPCRFLGQLVSGRGRQLERGVFRHKLAFFFGLSSICEARNAPAIADAWHSVLGSLTVFQC